MDPYRYAVWSIELKVRLEVGFPCQKVANYARKICSRRRRRHPLRVRYLRCSWRGPRLSVAEAGLVASAGCNLGCNHRIFRFHLPPYTSREQAPHRSWPGWLLRRVHRAVLSSCRLPFWPNQIDPDHPWSNRSLNKLGFLRVIGGTTNKEHLNAHYPVSADSVHARVSKMNRKALNTNLLRCLTERFNGPIPLRGLVH